MSYNIAIDGPAGAGKSTIAKITAAKLGFVYVDTGALYRAIGLYLLRNGIDPNDETGISSRLDEITVSMNYVDGALEVILNGEDVSHMIRTEEVGKMTSAIAVYGSVRDKLTQLQRNIAAKENVVMDGRDIGTCILPKADVKIYLTAASAIRAKRRCQELAAKGQPCIVQEIEKDIIERDYRDMNRKIAPLAQADDAVFIDSSYMTLEEVAAAIIAAAENQGLNWKE